MNPWSILESGKIGILPLKRDLMRKQASTFTMSFSIGFKYNVSISLKFNRFRAAEQSVAFSGVSTSVAAWCSWVCHSSHRHSTGPGPSTPPAAVAPWCPPAPPAPGQNRSWYQPGSRTCHQMNPSSWPHTTPSERPHSQRCLKHTHTHTRDYIQNIVQPVHL